MKTDVIAVSSKGNEIEEALALADKVAAYKNLSPKSALHLRLLTEEAALRKAGMKGVGLYWTMDILWFICFIGMNGLITDWTACGTMEPIYWRCRSTSRFRTEFRFGSQ